MFKRPAVFACGLALLSGSLLFASPSTARFVPREPSASADTRAQKTEGGKVHRARSKRHAQARRRAVRRSAHARTHHRRRGSQRVTGEPMVIAGFYPGAALVPTPAPVAQSRRQREGGFHELPQSRRSLVVTSATAPLPFTPGCTEREVTDHLGYGWFMLVSTRTCFVR